MNHLHKIYVLLQQQFHLIQNQSKVLYEIKQISSQNDIPKPPTISSLSFNIIPVGIRQHILAKSKSFISFELKFINFSWTVTIHFVEERLKIYAREYIQDINKILVWLLFVLNNTSFPKKSCMQDLSVYVYKSSLSKKLPKTNNDVISALHANTAFTTTCSNNPIIIIFRKEEWFKVFIHETFHTFSFDFSGSNTTKTAQTMNHLFCGVNPSIPIHLFEAYSEFWARIITLLIKELPETFNQHAILKKIQKEQAHSTNQLTKILKFMGNIKYENLFNVPYSNLYKENTNILSYYAITAMLLVHWEDMLEWCAKNNSKELSLVEFHNTYTNQISFCKLVSSCAVSFQMVDLMVMDRHSAPNLNRSLCMTSNC